LNIAAHDRETKLKHAIRFLGQGYKVRLTVQLMGREQAHPERATEFLTEALEFLDNYGKPSTPPVLKGRDAHVLLNPKAK
jgi:translation initiation factor IF-3